jgi:hypothetical protein
MTPRMAELRFPLRGRGARRAASSPPAAADPLATMAAEIQELDAAATKAAERIQQAAAQVGEGSGQSKLRVELMGGVATALVERTDQIRADCERLSSLMARTAKLVAERDGTSGAATAPAAKAATEAPPAPVTRDLPPPEPVEPEPPAQRPRWLEREEASSDTQDVDEGGTSEGVRLIATQMAIAGSSRSEIENRLRIQFGVVDAEQALDDIFGNRRSGVQ